jgi:thiamine biosynthesis lipoprotein
MGVVLEVEVEAADRAKALAASEAAVRAVEGVDRRLSVWRRDSDVSRINAAPVGIAIDVPPETLADLRWALGFAAATGGAFDPSIGPLVLAHGLRTEVRWPSPAELRRARAAVGAANFAVRDASIERRCAGASLDCDAFGKGRALDAALAAAVDAGACRAWFQFGGQVLHGGGAAKAVEVAIAHPDDRQAITGVLMLPAGRSAATSGNGERRTAPDGIPLGHLLDARTGLPARDFGSVTAIADSALLADAAATALFVLGPELGLELARGLRIDAVFVLRGERTGDAPRLVATDGAPLAAPSQVRFP